MRRDVFQAISDPTRREIIGLLAKNTLHLNAIAENFTISRPAISRHIRILMECGLIVITRQGRERYCKAQLEKLQSVEKWIKQYQVFWTGKLDALELHLAKTANSTKKLTSKNQK